ncbi:50S ribosomal protein L4 [Candidatus Woesearchaeota archaeon]|nr:MAG: 50S ribosomal protein L4 [Candidatus Woesearchaeota archaeon]
MKIKVLTLENKEKGERELPKQFREVVRPDLIRRAVLAIQSHKRQPYGADPEAGMKVSAELSRRRRNYRGSYGIGISRVPRKILSRQGRRMNWVGALAPGTVGGRRAHPPKSEKVWDQKINNKERRKAILSALAATVNVDYVRARGHKVPDSYPFAVDDSIIDVKKTADVSKVLGALGLGEELERTKERKVRAGIGKMRGRRYKKKTGPLIVVPKECDLMKSARNIPGLEVARVDKLNAELLAPGAQPGRLVIFTEGALDRMEKENLFAQ